MSEKEGYAKAKVKKLVFDESQVALNAAQERLATAREAVNKNHRELLRATRSDPLKVGFVDAGSGAAAGRLEKTWGTIRCYKLR